MRGPGRTEPFRTTTGDAVAHSVAEVGYCRLGGVDQWVLIRGRDLANPPLIHLHGGPGFSETRFFRHFNSELENRFTVVYWDQRGAGKSFHRDMARSSMTVEQFLTDLDELVDMVCARVGQEQVVLHGHSWGSLLGVLYADRHPERVAAYLGTAQIGDASAAESASYACAVAAAERRGNRMALNALRAIGPPPYPASSVFSERTWLQRLDGQLSPQALWKLRGAVFGGGREASPLDLVNQIRGFRFTMDAMWREVSALNLITAAPTVRMPVVFFLGRRDHWVPPETSVAYIEALAAPSKQLLWFDNSGHEPFVDEPAKFNHQVIETVRALVAH
ncbi:alpha/beta fold hydrolase [Mycolicibacterium hippocampi]|uniref:Alpha/beta hydrolase n=1 Tax=Mycolicibacterium hippocampi TaxID=659824 RepID=A0A7I9ZKB8_9MYCO|nr:alpha/beta hydrolase [Mycolicibacterium hippocampi]GFH01462.1 alpha/beta hydrolase [Mycolicibacterium hippocampi]